jgi:hypothetical protein
MKLLESKLFRFQHLSDETVSRLIAGELPPLLGFGARKHLAKCWHCRSRHEAFERAAMQVTKFSRYVAERIPSDRERRASLLAALRLRAQQTPIQPTTSSFISQSSEQAGTLMIPVLASIAIVFVATALLAWVWQRPSSVVSAAELLRRAETADQVVALGKPGVVYQKIRIITPNSSVEREIYRDSRGVRRRRSATALTEPVRTELSKAGVDWDAPLSVDSFRSWRDRQPVATDIVFKKNGNLLTLVTKVSNQWIQEESLTVRAADFHPVERTIRTNSSETIEIAELNYAVLDWSGVNEALFEPLISAPVPHLAPVVLPALPLSAALDSAELSVRVALNQLRADEGEQISVSRTDRSIEVKGIVETMERKEEIVNGLQLIPHVTLEVFSIPELKVPQPSDIVAQSIAVQSVDVQASALERYLTAKHHFDFSADDISRGLLEGSLGVKQNANKLTELSDRFSTMKGSHARDNAFLQLSKSYSTRLLASLDSELSTLDSLGLPQPEHMAEAKTSVDLTAEAARNEALCQELIAGNSSTSRSAEDIAPELYTSIARIRSAVVATTDSSQ